MSWLSRIFGNTEVKRLQNENLSLKRHIISLGNDLFDLAEQLALWKPEASGQERPSPPDIIQQGAVTGDRIIQIDIRLNNIPFTKPPRGVHIMDIPNTNSMDGAMDYGHQNLYLEPADEENRQIMAEWIAKQWTDSKGMLAADVVYRIMVDQADSSGDFSRPHKWYAIHRIVEVGQDADGLFFWFGGINNIVRDPYPARMKNILWLNIGTIF